MLFVLICLILLIFLLFSNNVHLSICLFNNILEIRNKTLIFSTQRNLSYLCSSQNLNHFICLMMKILGKEYFPRDIINLFVVVKEIHYIWSKTICTKYLIFKKAALENTLFVLHPETQCNSCTNLNSITLSVAICLVLRLVVSS